MREDIKLNYNDIVIVPETISDISSRSECDPYDNEGFLPIIASCMSSVVSIDNTYDFNQSGIRVVIPRTICLFKRIRFMIEDRNNFVAFSLKETEDIFIKGKYIDYDFQHPLKICIDIANGHMKSLINTIRNIKEKYGEKVVIMAGNIANPDTYLEYAKAGVDYARCSIGTGGACITSSNTAIHYPIFSLLKEIYNIKKSNNFKCKIIADGGIRGYGDIQKALIYADYVMCGSIFNKAIESAGKTLYKAFYWDVFGKKILNPFKTFNYYKREVPYYKYRNTIKLIKEGKVSVMKEFYGMASKKAQILINKGNKTTNALKTSEGLTKYQDVEYSIKDWAENERDYLKSAMSYTNSRTLEDYKDSKWVRVTNLNYNK